MKSLLLMTAVVYSLSYAESFDTYITNFDYKARQDMKIKTAQMLEMVSKNKAQLIDIRFA